MDFINTYFETKIGAAKGLFCAIKWALNERRWVFAILAILWTMFCIIGGTLLLPVDVIGQAIAWNVLPGWRKAMEESEELVKNFAID